MTTRTLEQWLTYIETLHHQVMELELSRVRAIAASLNLIEFTSTVISVAGTNGKGSTVALLESMYHQAGYTTASYTSPHIIDFRERIQLNREWVSEKVLSQAFEIIDTARGSTPLTYFEFTTLAALLIFQQAQPDVIILEVGLGGRLDAVNIVEPDLCVITTIDLDHQAWLGDDRESIAAEKAGIMRADIPCIFGDTDMPHAISEVAQRVGARLLCRQRDFEVLEHESFWQFSTESHQYTQLTRPQLPLTSAACAVMAVTLLEGQLPVAEVAIAHALANTMLRGRMQVLQQTPLVIADVAHNPASARYLAQQLEQYPDRRCVAVFSMLQDKDINGTIRAVMPRIDCWHISQLAQDRAASLKEMQLALVHNAQNYYAYHSVLDAYRTALSDAEPDDIIVIFGSFTTVAAVTQEINQTNKESA